MNYVEKLTALRIDNDIDQKTIAQILNCKQSAISKYETGRVNYKVEDIITLCKYYNVSSDYILGLPDDMPYPKR